MAKRKSTTPMTGYSQQRKKRNISSAKTSRPFRRRTNMARAIRSIALKNCEAKHTFIQNENIQLYHNVPQYNTNMLATQQGQTQLTRVGDEVVGQYLKLKFWLSNKSDRPGVTYRIILYSSPQNDFAMYFSSGSSGNRIISTVDTDRVKIIKQRFVKAMSGDYSIETSSTQREHSTLVSMSVNLKNRKIKYQTDSGTTPKWQGNYVNFCVIAYDSYGSLATDNIASYAWQSEFVFKDP